MAAAERENIINWTEGEKTARVYITSRKLKNRLTEYGIAPVEVDEGEPHGSTYELPRNYIRIQKPSGEGRVRTKEQRAAAIARLAKAREERAARRAAEAKKAKKAAPAAAPEETEEVEATPAKKPMKTVGKAAAPATATKPAPAADVESEDEEEVEVVKPKKKAS